MASPFIERPGTWSLLAPPLMPNGALLVAVALTTSGNAATRSSTACKRMTRCGGGTAPIEGSRKLVTMPVGVEAERLRGHLANGFPQ